MDLYGYECCKPIPEKRTISFEVLGRPQQRGSKKVGFIPKRGGGFLEKNGRPVVVARDANENSKQWMDSCKLAAMQVFSGELLTGPIELIVVFEFKRPGSHFGSGRNACSLKPSAPEFHTQSPDLDKLVRCLGDALTGSCTVTIAKSSGQPPSDSGQPSRSEPKSPSANTV